MTDAFAPFVEEQWLDRIVEVITSYPQQSFQLLTKRPERMRALFARRPVLRNLWLRTSVGQRRYLDRLDVLRTILRRRFVSFEPLLEDLGAIDLEGIRWAIAGAESDAVGGRGRCSSIGSAAFECHNGRSALAAGTGPHAPLWTLAKASRRASTDESGRSFRAAVTYADVDVWWSALSHSFRCKAANVSRILYVLIDPDRSSDKPLDIGTDNTPGDVHTLDDLYVRSHIGQ
jgi:hypothetical protein